MENDLLVNLTTKHKIWTGSRQRGSTTNISSVSNS